VKHIASAAQHEPAHGGSPFGQVEPLSAWPPEEPPLDDPEEPPLEDPDEPLLEPPLSCAPPLEPVPPASVLSDDEEGLDEQAMAEPPMAATNIKKRERSMRM
jgi:hypothetical protein